MYIKSLYTNIPNSAGIAAVKNAYSNYPKKSIATKVITKFLVTGTLCAPAYTNIFMASFEAKYIYPYIKEKVIKFLQFTNDLFMIWNGTEEELNQKKKTIKFDFKYSKTKIEFLDVLVYKTSIINYKQHQKPTDRQSYLLANSEHPRSLK